MKQVISKNRIPIKIWLDYVEDGALDQAEHLANLPFAYHHIALMPDCHQGYGMPIGGVMATEGVVVPNAVGTDVGCGMCAVRTNLKDINRRRLEKIIKDIKAVVPVGFKWHKHSAVTENDMPGLDDDMIVTKQEFDKARRQCGTLGGGNHFIEIQKGSDGYVWIMVHSGSRNLGKQVADYYNKTAVALNKDYYSEVPKSWQLAFLLLSSGHGKAYLKEMQYCVEFAFLNRKMMITDIKDIIGNHLPSVEYDSMINIAHNYAAMENHFGRNVMVHRKGATRAREGELGIIPGAQGVKSYIVRGKGNRDSFMSCSHGAGRKMGRKQAKKHLDLDREMKVLDDQNIVHSMTSIRKLDEARGAYKDIDEVMENQKDLVGIEVELRTLAVVKG